MRFRHELVYDAPPDEVFTMLSDPAFRRRVAAAQQVVSADVDVAEQGGGFRLVSTQVQNTAGLPAIAKKIAGDTTEVVVTEEWSGRDGGSIDITAPGKPTSARGTITLAPHGSGTRELVELEIKVKVPLVGGKLESLMAEQVKQGYLLEHEVGQAWLGGDR
jgi:uncharacterized protein YndB with AHSA1/START domain